MEPNLKMMAPQRISADRKLHLRVEMHAKTIDEYAEDMEAGDVFPPLLVFYDEAENIYRLVDGFHRLAAHLKVFPDAPILCEIRLGTYDDALWASFGVNQTHGYRRWKPHQGPFLARRNESNQ